MGLSILGALLMLAYSLYVQSPSRQMSYQIEPYLRESRVRMATTLAFALMLLTIGFYVAGVPLGENATAVVPTEESLPVDAISIAELEAANAVDVIEPTRAASSSAFAAPLAQNDDSEEVVAVEGGDSAETPPTTTETDPATSDNLPTATATTQPTNTPTPTPTNTPTATPIPTQTPTPQPTNTPTPTLTPTPITEATALVNTGGSTLWVKRSPGGQNLVILQDGDTVILLGGNANQAGLLWKEIKTVAGVSGWVQAQFLDFGEEGSEE